MEEDIQANTTKANLVNLTKMPATEFEKHFHEWMERDDVARGLQAKLRCDLIKNFNKTNLGKQLLSHMNSTTGGSTYRLTLTPLVLALNTLVSEFLYAQNCHFTLSVFCTEIPFHNTLPDFESMRNFRFNEREINDIWEAVTAAGPTKRCLDHTILDEYDAHLNNSLLLLIVKSLVEQKPMEMLRKSVEIQTEVEVEHSPHFQQTIPVEVNNQAQQSPAKSIKGHDVVKRLEKKLLIFSQKVIEMTQEFDLLIRQRHIQKPERKEGHKSSSCRELHTLNKSLDRIDKHVKQLSKSKRKGKRLTNIAESIDSLTMQFAKCAENFDQVTKELGKGESKPLERSEQISQKVTFKEHETEARQKTYADWIYEMRTTDNGKKFLERVESSLSKALAKHREQWQSETDVKMKQMKSQIKLHYKQKMLMYLSRQDSEEQTNETRKLNENIELKLKDFETKQTELLEKLKESSFELQEAQKQLHEVKILESSQINTNSVSGNDKEKPSKQSPNEPENVVVIRSETLNSAMQQKREEKNESTLTDKSTNYIDSKAATPRDHNVDKIINEAKLRLQQLEAESNSLEINFQNYLERRKQKFQDGRETSLKLIAQSQSKTSEIFRKFGHKTDESTKSKCFLHNIQSKSCPAEDDFELDSEFLRLKEKLQFAQLEAQKEADSSSSSSTEMKNAILEAKQKFFENEQKFRERKEREFSGQMQALYRDEQMDGNEHSFRHLCSAYKSQDNQTKMLLKETQNIASATTTGLKFESCEQFADLELRRTPRKELFPKQTDPKKNINSEKTISYHEPISKNSQDLKQALNNLKAYTENIQTSVSNTTETPTDLLKLSMAKMKQLFEQQPNQNRAKKSQKMTLTKTLSIHESDSEDQNSYSIIRDGFATSLTDIQNINLTTSLSNTTTTATSSSSVVTNVATDIGKKITDNLFVSLPSSSTFIAADIVADNQIVNLTNTSINTSNTTTTTTSTSSAPADVASNRAANIYPTVSILPSTDAAADDSVSQNQLEIFNSVSSINRISNISMPSILKASSGSEESLNIDLKESQSSASDDVDDFGEVISDKEDLGLMPKADSLEIGEVTNEPPQPLFAAMQIATSSESSTSTDSEMELPMGGTDKKLKEKFSDESESDFWA